MKEHAFKYIEQRLSVIPIAKDKLPIGRWKIAQSEIQQPDNRFNDCYGIGVVCGKVSIGLECIDIDCKYDLTGTMYQDYVSKIDKSLIDKLVIQGTANKGYHIIYRCSEISGNKKLAQREATKEEKAKGDKIKVLFETRGEGGYIAVAPTPGYKFIQRHLHEIPVITPEERSVLLTTAIEFNQIEKDVYYEDIFKAYNEKEDAIEILVKHGWREKGVMGDNILLKRPGETKSKWSATYHSQKKWFTVFSTSTEFDELKAYSPVAVLAKLEFKDNWKEVSEYLKKQGYGEKKRDIKKAPIASKNEIEIYFKNVIDGTLPQGLKLEVDELDKYFCFKKGLYLINGFDNVGKSIIALWKLVKMAQLYQWKFLIYPAENSIGFVSRKIVEFQQKKPLSECDIKNGLEFLDAYFSFIDNRKTYTWQEILRTFNDTDKDGLIIDPYDALKIDLKQGYNSYNCHEEAVTELQMYCRKEDKLIWINLHTYTGAARKLDADGLPKAPGKADTNYGVLFANSGDFFLTYHRKVQSKEKYRRMETHVRKVRETETGGRCTIHDKPVILELNENGTDYILWNEQTDTIDYSRPQEPIPF